MMRASQRFGNSPAVHGGIRDGAPDCAVENENG